MSTATGPGEDYHTMMISQLGVQVPKRNVESRGETFEKRASAQAGNGLKASRFLVARTDGDVRDYANVV